MLASRWHVVAFVVGCVFFGTGVSLAAQDALPDLFVSQVALAPSATVAGGEIVTATIVAERSGAVLSRDAAVDITWRRRDREEPCGTSAGVFPAGDGPLALQFAVTIPTSDLAPGAYEVIATIDPSGVIAESSETNNRLAASLDIVAPKPELHPVRAEIRPASPLLWGETATIAVGVMNTGRAVAGPFHVTFVVFPAYCVDETTGERWAVSPAEAAGSDGLLGWRFLSDGGGSESPETKGVAERARALPEAAWLVFSETQIAGLERDGEAEATAVLATGLPLRELLTIPGGSGGIASSVMAPLSSADAARLESCRTTYLVRVSLDDAYGVPDEDPANNALYMAVSVKPSSLELADLVPIAVSFSRAMPLAWDDDVDVEVTVANHGGGVAPAAGAAGIGVSFWYRSAGTASWSSLDATTMPRLGIDEETSSDTVETTIDAEDLGLAPGSYELRIVVDGQAAIPERDEQNNELVLGFSVQGTELHPVGLDVSSSTVRQGESVDIVATIENTGERSLEGFSVGFFLGDARFATSVYRASTTSDPGLEEEDRARTKGTLSTQDLAPGTYELRVVADPDNRVPELDETNNQIRTSITILAPAERLAELFVSEVVLSPASPIPAGQSFVVQAQVRNGGTIDAGRFSVAFAIVREDGTTWNLGRVDCTGGTASAAGSQACACQSANGLARGAAQAFTYTVWTADWPEGAYALHVWVDPPTSGAARGEVRELDDANNEMVLAFSLGRPVPGGASAGPDLVVDVVSLQPAVVPAGAASAMLYTTIANRGSLAAEPFDVDIRWIRPGGAPLSVARSHVDGLDPSQSVSIQHQLALGSIGWSCGNHTFEVVADIDDAVAEANESDNAASAALRVDCGQGTSSGPDLVAELRVPTARNGAVTAGCPATAEVVVTNRGSLTADAFCVELRQDGSPMGTQNVTSLSAQGSVTLHFDLSTESTATHTLSAFADADGRVEEEDEANNTATVTLAFVARADSSATRIGGPYRAAVGTVLVDSTSGIAVAASDDGVVHAFARGLPPTPLYDASLDDDAKVVGLAIDRGTATRTIYVATASGNLHRLALSSGTRIGTPVRLGVPATCLALDAAGTAFVGTESGVAVVRRTGAVAATATLGARVIDLAIDTSGSLVYVLTPTALYSLAATSLSVICTAGSFGAEATAMALGPQGIYVGTASGRVIAFSPCTSYGSLGTAMLKSWSVDLSSSGGSVTSLAAYAEAAADPVYVGLCESGSGRIVGLSLAGRMLWTTDPEAGIGCISADLAADRRRGRVTAAETDGTIRAVSDIGEAILEEDALAGLGKTFRSGAAADSLLAGTDGTSGVTEIYYMGTSDGSVYVVAVARGGCP